MSGFRDYNSNGNYCQFILCFCANYDVGRFHYHDPSEKSRLWQIVGQKKFELILFRLHCTGAESTFSKTFQMTLGVGKEYMTV